MSLGSSTWRWLAPGGEEFVFASLDSGRRECCCWGVCGDPFEGCSVVSEVSRLLCCSKTPLWQFVVCLLLLISLLVFLFGLGALSVVVCRWERSWVPDCPVEFFDPSCFEHGESGLESVGVCLVDRAFDGGQEHGLQH